MGWFRHMSKLGNIVIINFMENKHMNHEIYFIELDESIEFSKYEPLLRLLSPEKKERILRFHFEIDRKLGVVSDLLVRYLACRYLEVDNSELIFETNEYGKPFLLGKPNFHYNVTHTRNAIAVAVSNSLVGVDVEKIREYENGIVKRFFDYKEQEYIEKNPESANRNFYEIWTKKESYIKWKGKGLLIPLNSFDVLDEKLPCFFEIFEKKSYVISACIKNKRRFDFQCITEEWLYKTINEIF